MRIRFPRRKPLKSSIRFRAPGACPGLVGAPRFAAFCRAADSRISLTAIEIDVYDDSCSRSHNPEVTGSNPAPASARSAANAADPTIHEGRRRETSAVLSFGTRAPARVWRFAVVGTEVPDRREDITATCARTSFLADFDPKSLCLSPRHPPGPSRGCLCLEVATVEVATAMHAQRSSQAPQATADVHQILLLLRFG